ncbi:GlxA family transcriptional regulator [Rhodospirillum sp. A1_3_36]|uniref:GlxA family transcriptional regulator n=1 Tax=Rhodospirillum sp. A1_3_36 TaxID=3391666 RepID=UPI0039A7423B
MGTETEPKIFEFVLMHAFSMMSVISAIEPLRVANRIVGRDLYGWSITSEDGQPAQASNGLEISGTHGFGAGPMPDYTFVCAGLSLTARNQSRLNAFLNKRFRSGVKMGAISMGTIFLARAGLLGTARCTIHWEGKPAFVEEFPDIDLTSAIYEIDGGIMTCAGGLSSFDLFLGIIAADHGQWLVRAIANQLQNDRVRSGVFPQHSGSDTPLSTAPRQVRLAVALIAENMENPMSPGALADAVGSSRRTLERLFLKYVGMTPSKYCKTKRLERARDLLLHSNMSTLDVAVATGFRSGSYFSFCFSEQYGQSPSAIRRDVERGGH